MSGFSISLSELCLGFVVVGAILLFLEKRRRVRKRWMELSESKETDQEEEAKEEENKVDMLVLYGSQTGTAEGFANELTDKAESFGLVASAIDLEDYSFEQLKNNQATTTIYLMATYGEGDPTDNAVDFINDMKQNLDQITEDSTLDKHHFAVFGLGNTQYEHYNEMGKFVFKSLVAAAASPLLPLGLGDDDNDIESDFNAWKEKLWAPLCEACGVVCKESSSKVRPGKNLVVKYHQQKEPETPFSGPYTAREPFTAEVIVNDELYTSERSCRHISLKPLDCHSNVSYLTGDHIGILPLNAPHIVDGVVARLGVDPSAIVSVGLTDEHSASAKIPFNGTLSIREVLETITDVTTTVTMTMCASLALLATDEAEIETLSRLSSTEGKDEFHSKYHERMVTLLEMLELFPSVAIDLASLLAIAPRLQVRYYSICSSHLVSRDVVDICVAVVTYSKPDNRKHDGICSTFLQQLKLNSKVSCFIRSSNFYPPADVKRPMLLVGPGTGIAPFIGFIQSRKNQIELDPSAERGLCEVYYGSRHEESEFLYKDLLLESRDSGCLSNLHLAFSRDSGKKVYVQHLIVENAKTIWKILSEDGIVYICGLVQMSKEVIEALKEVIQSESGKSQEWCDEFWTQLRENGRFKTDVWS